MSINQINGMIQSICSPIPVIGCRTDVWISLGLVTLAGYVFYNNFIQARPGMPTQSLSPREIIPGSVDETTTKIRSQALTERSSPNLSPQLPSLKTAPQLDLVSREVKEEKKEGLPSLQNIEIKKSRWTYPWRSAAEYAPKKCFARMEKTSLKAFAEHDKKEQNIYIQRQLGDIKVAAPVSIKARYISESKGTRDTMEDTSFTTDFPDFSLMGVFDGHGGSTCSQFLRVNYALEFEKNYKDTGNVYEAFEKTTYELNKKFLETQAEQGSTGVVCLLDTKNGLVYTSTLGDSEANIYPAGQIKSIALSCVRDWGSKRDRERYIEAYLIKDPSKLPENPKLIRSKIYTGVNVARSFGDPSDRTCRRITENNEEKKPLVVEKPKITVIRVKPGDKLILVSDGVKDYLTETEIAQLIHDHYHPSTPATPTKDIAKKIGDFAINNKKSKDNVTVMALEIA